MCRRVPIEAELWRIFTWYCANGTSLDIEHLHKRHFVALLKHCGLINDSLTKAQANVVYTSEACRRSGGRLTFYDFLNALYTVAKLSLKPASDGVPQCL